MHRKDDAVTNCTRLSFPHSFGCLARRRRSSTHDSGGVVRMRIIGVWKPVLAIVGILTMDCLVTALAPTDTAYANTLPAPLFSAAAGCQSGSDAFSQQTGPQLTPQSPGAACLANGFAGGTGFAGGQNGLLFTQQVSGNAIANLAIGGGIVPNSFGSAGVNFYFEAITPTAQLVPVIVTSSVSAEATVNGSAIATVSMGDLFNNTVYLLQSQGGGSNSQCRGTMFADVVVGCSAITVPQTVLFASNALYRVALQAGSTAISGGTAFASADPFFQVDPSFADASQVQLLFSPGIDNSPLSAVPEPSSIVLMSAGIPGLWGFVWLRTRRERSAPLTSK